MTQNTAPMVDAFLYAGESDMLDLRLQTLSPVVDAFLAVSGDHTHQGARLDVVPPAGCYHHIERLAFAASYGHSLVGSRAYQRIERAQRTAIRPAVHSLITDDPRAIVLVSDVDEIPDPTVVPQLADRLDAARDSTGTPWLVLEQRFHSTTLDQLHPTQPWLGTTVSRLGECRPQRMRDARGPGSVPFECARVERGGWHFSWFGTTDERARKRATISHGELARSRWVCAACGRPEWDDSIRTAASAEGGNCRFCAAPADYVLLDPFDVAQRDTHSNGEKLRLLSPEERIRLDWPAPILDDVFWTPDSWNYSGKGGDVR